MADVLRLREVVSNVRCPDCANPDVIRKSVRGVQGLWKLWESCKCGWTSRANWVRV